MCLLNWKLLNSIYHITHIPYSHDSKKRSIFTLPYVPLKNCIISTISLCNNFKFCIKVLLLKFLKRQFFSRKSLHTFIPIRSVKHHNIALLFINLCKFNCSLVPFFFILGILKYSIHLQR